MKDATVRFVRLKYGRSDWDDGMAPEDGADTNFLAALHRCLALPVASKGEAIAMRELARYPRARMPPIVYMTGNAGRIRASRRDEKAVREYLLGGGMLLADAGSPDWAMAFQRWMGKVLPGKELQVIADDDPIFRVPYTFPHGAPPLWHHGGRQAKGIAHKGRWCVFFHPGDLNDAWKVHRSGLAEAEAASAIELGINVFTYAHYHYELDTRRYRMNLEPFRGSRENVVRSRRAISTKAQK